MYIVQSLLVLFACSLAVAFEDMDETAYVDYPGVKMKYKFHKEVLIWNEARAKCTSEGGRLAMPKNAEEAAILKSMFNEHPRSTLAGNKPDRMMLNFHDQFIYGEYLLENGESIQYGYHKWAPGQPNNLKRKEHCGSMDRAGDIDDFPCDERAAFACQKGPSFDVTKYPDENCPTRDNEYIYKKEFKKCYKYHIDPKPWPVARTICNAEGGNLAIIKSKSEEEFLIHLMNKPENNVTHVPCKCCALLGFHDQFKEKEYLTVFGDPLESTGYVNWNKNNPTNTQWKEDCGSLHREGGFNDIDCDVPTPYICELVVSAFEDLNPDVDERVDLTLNI